MSVHLYSLPCGQGYFFLGTDDVGVPEEGVALLAVLLVLLLDLGAAVVVVLLDVLMGGGGSAFTVDEEAGGAEVGSFFDFVVGSAAWLDWRGGIEGRLCCVAGGPRGLMRWFVV